MADQPSTSSQSVTKNPKGKILKSGQRLMCYNVYLKHKENGLLKSHAIIETAAEVGIGQKSVWQIVGDMEKTGKVESPPKTRSRQSFFSKLREEDKKALRHAVHAFFKRNEIPTLDKVLHAITENEFIPPMSRSVLYKVLKKLDFVWEKRGRNSMLTERDDIIIWRRRYLTQIKKFRQEGRVIYYLDETWLNAGHTKSKVWKDKSIVNARQAFIEDLSVGLKNPSGKGQRLIITKTIN